MKSKESVNLVFDLDKLSDRTDEFGSDISYEFVKETAEKLKRFLYENKELPAISAPQLGINLRMFVVKLSKTENSRFKVFLNPIVVSGEGLHLSREICPNILGKQFIIPRRNKIHVAYQEVDGQPSSETYISTYGEVVQQMIEILDGILISDYGLDLDDVGGIEDFDKASGKQKQEVIGMYLDQLRSNYSALRDEIENNPELKQIDQTIDKITDFLLADIEKKENTENAV